MEFWMGIMKHAFEWAAEYVHEVSIVIDYVI
jgi:hypothetical protein